MHDARERGSVGPQVGTCVDLNTGSAVCLTGGSHPHTCQLNPEFEHLPHFLQLPLPNGSFPARSPCTSPRTSAEWVAVPVCGF
jgi:hypothetical protein